MGLTIHYTLKSSTKSIVQARKLVKTLRQKTLDLPFKEVGSADAPAAADASSGEVLFEPSQEVIFERLLPKNIEIQIFRSLLDSQASEEAARMAAMENATKSADDMIKRLTLQYNKARQASITKELMDIVGGVEALKK